MPYLNNKANESTERAPQLPNYCQLHVPCLDCGYDLWGALTSDKCPECGHCISLSTQPGRAFFLPRNVVRLFALTCIYWLLWLFTIPLTALFLASPLSRTLADSSEFAFPIISNLIVFGGGGVAALFVGVCYARKWQEPGPRALGCTLAIAVAISIAGYSTSLVAHFSSYVYPIANSRALAIGSPILLCSCYSLYHFLVVRAMGLECGRFLVTVSYVASFCFILVPVLSPWLADWHWAAFLLGIGLLWCTTLVSALGSFAVFARTLRRQRQLANAGGT